jgi:hypothetical protein
MKYNQRKHALAIAISPTLRGGAFVQPWPRQERVLSPAERLVRSRRLADAASTAAPDGQLGGQTWRRYAARPRSRRRRTGCLLRRPAFGGCEGAETPVPAPESNPEHQISGSALTAAVDARFMGWNLPACGPIPPL